MADGQSSLDMDIAVTAGDWSVVTDAAKIAEQAARAAFAAAADDVPSEAGILLSDDAAVQGLNRDYRGKDKPTNVLSFAAQEGDMPTPDGAPILLGDIVIALETLSRESADEGKATADHLSHLVVHGMLHLLGYDHQTDAEADEMESLEVRILQGLDIKNPYGETRD